MPAWLCPRRGSRNWPAALLGGREEIEGDVGNANPVEVCVSYPECFFAVGLLAKPWAQTALSRACGQT